tara:strand:- start:1925 stop:4312 length:2388 start_codon:yes stop_codon:yes gene_type:complete
MNIKLKNSVLNDLGFNNILNEYTKFSHSSDTTNKLLEIKPVFELDTIRENLNKTSCFISKLQKNEKVPIEIFPNIKPIINSLRIENKALDEHQFKDLFKFLEISNNLKNILNNNSFLALKPEIETLYINLIGQQKITNTFDETWYISKNASPKLSKIYNSINSLESSIDNITYSFFKKAKENKWLQQDNMKLIDNRKLIPMKINCKRKINGIIVGKSSSGKAVYIEPIEIIEKRNKLIELEISKKKEENLILLSLTNFFRDEMNEIKIGYKSVVMLDFYHCIAKFSFNFNCFIPNFDPHEQNISISQGRNPLLLIQKKNIVPLNFEINKKNKILLITGPNAGGKTVVIKTIGLFVLMAQSGLHVPCKNIKLPIFKKIFTDIGDRQSIEDDLSTYSAHLNEISSILKNCDQDTLILMDELGTGTDPDAGASLSQAFLEHTLDKQSWLIATTHLGKLKIWAHETKGVQNSRMMFDHEKLFPTYKLILGKPGSSFALEIANRMKIDNNVIDRAKELLGDKSLKVELLLSELEKERRELKKIKNRMQKQRKYIQEAEDRIHTFEYEAEKKYNEAEEKATKNAHKFILDTRKEIEKLIEQIKSNEANKLSIREARQTLDAKLRIINQKEKKITQINESHQYKSNENKLLNINNLKIGTKVKIPFLNTSGVIINLTKSKKQSTIEFNGKKMRVNSNKIIPINEKEDEKSEETTGKINYSKPSTFQLDIRGKRVEESLELLTQFLDGALVSGLNYVRILHGKGTGALQNAVINHLKNQSFISEFQHAHPDSGGTGITEVKLK